MDNRRKPVSFNHFRSMIKTIHKDLRYMNIPKKMLEKINNKNKFMDISDGGIYIQISHILERLFERYKKSPFKKSCRLEQLLFLCTDASLKVSYMFCNYNKNGELTRVLNIKNAAYILFRINLRFHNANNDIKYYKKLIKI